LESSVPNPNIFHFASEEQKHIYEKLLRLVGPGPASFFKDACAIMNQSPLLESATHLVSHLLREIESALRDVLEPVVEAGSSERDKPETHKEAVLAILKYLGISESDPVSQAWVRLTERGTGYPLHARAHRRDLSEPRPLDQEFIEFWQQNQTVLRIVLDKFETHFASVFDILDKALTETKPTSSVVKQLRDHVPNNIITWSYFFSNLKDDKWLVALREAGFFHHPPEPQVDKEKKSFRVSPWPQSQYLARISSKSPNSVLETLMEIPETENQFVHSDLADAAIAMPPELAAKWAQKETVWVEKQKNIDLLLPQKFATLINTLANGGQTEVTLDFVRALLSAFSLEKDETVTFASHSRARIDDWHYAQIVGTIVPTLTKTAVEDTLNLFCDLLDSTVQAYSFSQKPQDYSNAWRPSVEGDIDENFAEPKQLLVSVVRDVATETIKRDSTRRTAVVQLLEERDWLIFRRIALHLLRIFLTKNDPLILEHLTDRVNFDQSGLWHEYSLLVENHFGELTAQDQEKILGWIVDSSKLDKMLGAEQKIAKDPAKAKEEAERSFKMWQLTKLAPIHESLQGKWKSLYTELTAELGEPPYADAPLTTVSFVGPSSPKKAEELASLSLTDIVAFLKNWTPTGEVLGSSPEGLGRVLTGVVSSNPVRFASEAILMQGLDSTYVRAFITGFSEAARQKRSFEWPRVLELCQWAVEQPRDIPIEKHGLESDVGWAWTRKAIAELLSLGFSTDQLTFELRDRAWKALQPLTEDPNPTPEEERANYTSFNMNPSELSINSVRGEAMHCIVAYALWIRRHLEKLPNKEQLIASGFDEISEARAVLDMHLDPKIEPALAIRAIYGQHFPQLVLLDRKWVTNRLSTIFPHDAPLKEFREAAWDTYLVYCTLFDVVYDVLREEYSRSVELVNEITSRWRYVGTSPSEGLARHVMILYYRGLLKLGDALLQSFFEKAPDNLRAYALTFVGQCLRNSPGEIPATVLTRLRVLWEWRLEVETSKSKPGVELSAFGWWFSSAKFEKKWALTQLLTVLGSVEKVELDHEVIKTLVELANDSPEQVVECLSLMVQGLGGPLLVIASSEEIRSILNSAIQSESAPATEKAKTLVNRLSAMGHLEFRVLLK
jgi:hypothetical protein